MNTLEDNSLLQQTFFKELSEVRHLLQTRAKAFIEEAKVVGLKHYPYVSGFFVTIPVLEPKAVFERLKAKDIFVVPLSGAIRVALAAISLPEIHGLAAKIKQEI
jgi:aromatic-amino-acid transaminase